MEGREKKRRQTRERKKTGREGRRREGGSTVKGCCKEPFYVEIILGTGTRKARRVRKEDRDADKKEEERTSE